MSTILARNSAVRSGIAHQCANLSRHVVLHVDSGFRSVQTSHHAAACILGTALRGLVLRSDVRQNRHECDLQDLTLS